ncbi:hypothetical protein FA10DRAFT_288129 [Acaromyces ingoldii]|uniref:Uncharacterized protein n=1 Tax=Acaromyces ingoldii TaxID=215250 RepID=A0A316YID5_9BASI|nr:hypothetical protein FA10DRAFT_288129 [Acaromyces ingoldii]PWN88594.1 hypothetical protein FA10DRAFT_288129 [Acaromyces ingoldii]
MALLPTSLEPLLARVSPSSAELPPLRPTKIWDTTLTDDIDATHPQCLRAALHLLNDDIDRAHTLAQDDEGDMTSNVCHAVLHRREGDYWNSKWWYRQIKHPLIEQSYGSTADAQAFVDAVESAVAKRSSTTACGAQNLDRLKRKQADELNNLVRFALDQR